MPTRRRAPARPKGKAGKAGGKLVGKLKGVPWWVWIVAAGGAYLAVTRLGLFGGGSSSDGTGDTTSTVATDRGGFVPGPGGGYGGGFGPPPPGGGGRGRGRWGKKYVRKAKGPCPGGTRDVFGVCHHAHQHYHWTSKTCHNHAHRHSPLYSHHGGGAQAQNPCPPTGSRGGVRKTAAPGYLTAPSSAERRIPGSTRRGAGGMYAAPRRERGAGVRH